MHRRCNNLVFTALALAAGTCFQFSGCGLGDLGSLIANFNPCGTILNCDPELYAFIRADYNGPGVDPDIDPSCTYPPYCPSSNDPFVPVLTGINA
jgi:hypothetical protein